MRAPLSAAVAIAFGLLVLLGYFIPVNTLTNIGRLLTDWAVIVVAFAGLIGILNLLVVHTRKIVSREKHDYYSIILLVGFLGTFAYGMVAGWQDPTFQKAVLSIQVPVEGSLMGLLSITLLVAGWRLLQRRKGILGVIFMVSAVVFLIVGSGILAGLGDLANNLVSALNFLPLAGGRGILLGVGLGSLTAGIRVLMGADRPYSG